MISTHHRLFILVMVTFFLSLMFTYYNYNENFTFRNHKHIVLSESDYNLLNYLKSSHRLQMYENLKILDKSAYSTYGNSSKKQLVENKESVYIETIAQLKSTENLEQSDKSQASIVKQSSTTFSLNQNLVNKKLSNNLSKSSNNSKNNDLKNKKSQDLSKKILLAKQIKETKELKKVTSSFLPDAKNNSTLLSSSNSTKLNLVKKASIIVNPHIHGPEEVKLATEYRIGKKEYCLKDHGFGLDLLVMVVSSPVNFKARKAIRKTWGGLAVERGSKLLFVVGRASNKITPVSNSSEQLDNLIKEEDNEFGDILQANFVDGYYNLTLKTISIINWINGNCENVKYILKVDDDMFVNMQLLVDFAETRTFKNVIIGKIAKKWLPHRNPRSKWYVPLDAYKGTIYPNFATGPAYLISGTAIKSLFNEIFNNDTKVIKLEDVFLAGIIAEKSGIKRLNYSLFKNSYLEVNKCNFMRFITSHQHSPQEIIRQWNLVYSDKKIDCNAFAKDTSKQKIKKPNKLVQTQKKAK